MSFAARVQTRVRQSVKDRGLRQTILRILTAPYYLPREYVRWRSSFDARYGVDTEKRPQFEPFVDWNRSVICGAEYEPVKPELFRKAVEALPIRYEDFTFVDLGSGKGRALLLASEYPFRQIVGIELGPQLCKVAQRNVLKYKAEAQKCSSFRLIEADFTSCVLPPGNVLIYFFNPCPEPEMRRLIANIKQHVAAQPREVYILYVNPVLKHLIEDAKFTMGVGRGDKWLSYRCTNRRQLPGFAAA